jgi:DNA-binding MarR family transcriptional regulator
MPGARRDVDQIRIALVELRRLFQRSELAREWAAAFGTASKLDYTELRLLDAVRSSTPGGSDTATVGEIAERLGIDPSRASRLVARSVARGTLSRHASSGDGRRVVLRVTAAGAELQDRGSDLTRARIALAIGGWPARDRAAFAELFARFADSIGAPPVRARRSRGRRQAAGSRGLPGGSGSGATIALSPSRAPRGRRQHRARRPRRVQSSAVAHDVGRRHGRRFGGDLRR